MNREHETPEHKQDDVEDMLPEYDFSGGIRGKYAARYKASSNVVVLDEDVARAFPNTESGNQALRMLVQIAQRNELSRNTIEIIKE